MEENEIWKDIVGFEKTYQVSNLGKIRNKITNNILKIQYNNHGYQIISLRYNNKNNIKTVHSLVAKTFIPNILNKRTVNHKDGDKSNNNISNLEWMTHSENNKHCYSIGLRKGKWLGIKGKDSPFSKIVYQYSKNFELIRKRDSGMDIQRELGFSSGTIAAICRGLNKSAYGFIWKYNTIGN